METKIDPQEITIRELYTLSATAAQEYLAGFRYPWEALAGIAAFVQTLQKRLPAEEYEEILPGVFLARDARIASGAVFFAPTVIGHESEVRPGAYLRGSVLVGNGCVVGNSTELKNCILFDGVQVPHYNYVGDSILGYKSHMGAGSITSNVKSDKKLITIKGPDGNIDTGIKKIGAFLGDNVEVGCGSVLNPGTIVGRESNIYPLSSVRGCVPTKSIYKNKNEIVEKK